MYLATLILKTNGDVLGILLFIALITYFVSIHNKHWYEYVLGFGCMIALVVDACIVIKCLRQNNVSS